MAEITKEAHGSLLVRRYRQMKLRQPDYRFGPKYEAISKAVRGEVGDSGLSGTLPARKVGREINAMSTPEKFFASLALYHPCLFELHDQHVHYPGAKMHPLARHPQYSDRPWPSTEGTFSLAQRFGVEEFHPKTWDSSAADGGCWEIGCWVGDYLGFFVDAEGPYIVFYQVKECPEDHGQPGGPRINRFKPRMVAEARARRAVCAAYAEQLGSRVEEVSTTVQIPNRLGLTLVNLCRQHDRDVELPDTAVAELLQAFKESVGTDEPARLVAKRVVPASQLEEAKKLLQIAVWERHVRVDLHQPILFDHPLLPEQQDLLIEFAQFFRRA